MGAGLQEVFGDGKRVAVFAELQEITTCEGHTLWDSTQVREAKDQ